MDELYSEVFRLKFLAFNPDIFIKKSVESISDPSFTGKTGVYKFRTAWIPEYPDGSVIEITPNTWGQWMKVDNGVPDKDIIGLLSVNLRETLKAIPKKLKNWFCEGAPHKVEVKLEKFRHKRRVYYRIRGEFSALQKKSAEKIFDRRMRECEYDDETGKYELI